MVRNYNSLRKLCGREISDRWSCHSMIIAIMTLLSVNTVILEQKKEDKITPGTHWVRDYIQWTNENSTLLRCPYVDKFPLSEDIFVRICVNEKQSNLTIDIRRLNGYEAAFEGIQWNLNQWLYLKTYRFFS